MVKMNLWTSVKNAVTKTNQMFWLCIFCCHSGELAFLKLSDLLQVELWKI